ncbi:MAG: alpha-glucosidase, partial [Proteobacteria bacterium]
MQKAQWWKEVVVYQVYPRSFMDSNGDGVGDLPGLISKLDYLKDLGIDVIWICPMYKSPQDDNGYDISDYQDIHDEFGTMADFDHLLSEVHKRGMRLIIDLVINHTSDEHPWFIESKSSANNPKRDWYIWRDARKGKEPNNWESIFGGSAWKYDEATEQYFMHIFSAKQPDLNWENADMRKSVYAMIRWWLDKGIDGFRIDAISHMKKEDGLLDIDNPDNLEFVPSYSKHMNMDGVQEYLRDLCQNTFVHYDIMTVGEANGVSAEDAEEWVIESEKKLNMIIQFEHVALWDTNPEKRIDLMKVKDVFTRWQRELENRGWNALFVENHDVPRIISKWGDAKNFWYESATSIATMYFMMQGTPFIYQGQEIGMVNTVFNGPEDFNDVSAKNTFRIER